MKVGKPKSKRTPVRLRHKIQKASAAKQRKDRKLAKNNPEWRSRIKKDPGIPNLFPYKDKLLREIEQNKLRKEEDAQRRKDADKARRQGLAVEDTMGDQSMDQDDLIDYAEYSDDDDNDDQDETMADDGANPMAALVASARARAQEYDNEQDEDEEDDGSDWSGFGSDQNSRSTKEHSRHAYDKTFKDVLAASDVVLYILDARDPEGTRSRVIEQEIIASPDKRLILILNKIDLVPADVLRNWLLHLRRSFPTLPLRTTSPGSSSFDHTGLTSNSTATTILKALKSWASGQENLKRAISVGVLGYPNVGKSSVINALISLHSSKQQQRGAACPVGATAGLTTAMRTVKLDSRLTLLDSPGIVFPSNPHTTSAVSSKIAEQARLILLNAIPPKEIQDPQPAVTLLLKRLSSSPQRLDALLNLYSVPPLMAQSGKDMTTDFLVQVARKRGRLGKGGVPNLHSAAMVVVNDWREGRIQGWVDPPVQPVTAVAVNASNSNVDKSNNSNNNAASTSDPIASTPAVLHQKVVSQWAEEFKLDGLWGDDSNISTQ